MFFERPVLITPSMHENRDIVRISIMHPTARGKGSWTVWNMSRMHSDVISVIDHHETALQALEKIMPWTITDTSKLEFLENDGKHELKLLTRGSNDVDSISALMCAADATKTESTIIQGRYARVSSSDYLPVWCRCWNLFSSMRNHNNAHIIAAAAILISIPLFTQIPAIWTSACRCAPKFRLLQPGSLIQVHA